MNRTLRVFLVLLAAACVCGCAVKAKKRHTGPAPDVIETPGDAGKDDLDIDRDTQPDGDTVGNEGPSQGDTDADEALPMDTDFLNWRIVIDQVPQRARIEEALTRTMTIKLENTLERLLTGQVVIDAPLGVRIVPGTTIGWRLRAGRSADIPAQIMLPEGISLGRVTLPVQVNVLGQAYRSTQLDLYKWLDVRVIGSFPLDAAAGTVYPPEKKVDFERGCKWKDTAYAWRGLPLKALHPDGMIDFAEIYGEKVSGCAYAVLNLHAEAAVGVVLTFACDSPSTVWLDGGQVLNAPGPIEQAKPVELMLNKGANTLLFKCLAADTGWAFTMSVAGKQGALPPGVRFDLVLRQADAE